MKTVKVGMALCAALVIAVPAAAAPAESVLGDGSYVAPPDGSEQDVEVTTATEEPYVLADAPREKFVSPAGILRAGVTPNGEVALTLAAYADELDVVCIHVGESLDRGSDAAIAQALDQAVADVEELATPSSFVAFEQRLIGLAERQAELIRSLADGQAADADALGAELEQVESDIDALFVSRDGFEVCGQA
jgi:hypothetical protein